MHQVIYIADFEVCLTSRSPVNVLHHSIYDMQIETAQNRCFFISFTYCTIHIKTSNKENKLTLEKMSRHFIQWLLACNLLSYFVCTFKNVAEGCIHAINANMGGALQSL